MPKEKRQPQEGDVVLVRWRDTTGRGRWVSREEARTHQLLEIHTVGFYLNENKDCIRLHMQCDSELKEVSDTTVIPKGTIDKVSIIKRGKKSK